MQIQWLAFTDGAFVAAISIGVAFFAGFSTRCALRPFMSKAPATALGEVVGILTLIAAVAYFYPGFTV
ncbi:hypothetical protein [Paraburkholderia youngii]|uniref:hypothetical protein n=1 Tax=Paraburkholderia youngii TaxID=2782701 RepID=UPI003D2250D2